MMRAAYTVFWAVPSQYLKDDGAAGGIALINTIGLFGGFLSLSIIGWVRTTSGSMQMGLLVMAALLIAGAMMVIRTPALRHGVASA